MAFQKLKYTDKKRPTLKDTAKLRAEVARMAKKWGWTIGEFEAYCLRMGVNRCLALERYQAAKEKKASKRTTKKAA